MVRNAATVILVVGALSTSGHPLTAQQYPGTTPGARVCVICDFGTPRVDFPNRSDDPAWPREIGRLVEGSDQGLWGTSPNGGKDNNDRGTIFKISPDTGKIVFQYSFDGVHGAGPRSGLIDGGDTYLYGTTREGGQFGASAIAGPRGGVGTLFRIKPGDKEPVVLHAFRNGDGLGMTPPRCDKPTCSFTPQQRLDAAGSYPLSAPVRANDGQLYGVAQLSNSQTLGVLYRVAPSSGGMSGIQTLCADGTDPADSFMTDTTVLDAQLRDRCLFTGVNGNSPVSLTAGPDGNLYGATYGGLASNPYGTIFKAEPSGQGRKVTTLYKFDLVHGSKPYNLIVGRDGALYGTTAEGGATGAGTAGPGVVYRMPVGGALRVLKVFSGREDGGTPIAGLVQGRDRQLYGATRVGGIGGGTLFRITETGSVFQVLHRFHGLTTGYAPLGALVQHTNGNIYGTTYQGGTYYKGALYRLSGVNLPAVKDLTDQPTFSGGVARSPEFVSVPGEPGLVRIDVRTKVWGNSKAIAALTDGKGFTDGFTIDVNNCRNAHILQFIYREKLRWGSDPIPGTFMKFDPTTGGVIDQYPFTTVPGSPEWHTDTLGGKPNGYYDMNPYNPMVPTRRSPFAVTIFDMPTFGDPRYFYPGAPETWRATLKDLVVCNCKVAAVVNVVREQKWVPDTPNPPVLQQTTGKSLLPAYTVSIDRPKPTEDFLVWSNAQFAWANTQLATDGYEPVP